MEVFGSSKKLDKVLNDDKLIIKNYGKQIGIKIIQRREELLEATDLTEISTVPPPRLHGLHGDKEGQFAVDISKNFRITFEAYDSDESQTTERHLVKSILILTIEDYH